ncbi:MAG TPA: glycosyltransferase family 1 protein, partial [Candidatus Sulfotelmatobacter sp.]|nr:glycosyltransferase family 1 protein [Candidatus Sulfotelmatobacter sp.]
MIYADQRWIGNHGIGRFARHVLAGLEYEPVRLQSNPAAALDSWFLARALKQLNGNDLFFSPGYNTPLTCTSPFVFTIHDLTHVYCPESHRFSIHLYYATVLKRACRRAARILTVSEFTRKQIIHWSGVSQEKVVNVANGVDSSYTPEGETFGFPSSYFLSVSNRKPHKNEFRLVEAFARAKLGCEIQLVFTGDSNPQLLRWIEEREVGSRVKFVGNVPEEELPSLYRGATALVFPSLYEGFGLPIVEAMACGTPVITSNTTAMPEVAGDAAVFVDPRSAEQISGAMEQIFTDTSLRQQLRDKGFCQARRFRWSKTAEMVHDVL